MKKTVLVFIVLFFVFFYTGCGEKVTKITATSNGQKMCHIGPDSGLPGNCEWFIMLDTNHGETCLTLNGPGAAIGFQFRDGATIYVQDRYVGPNGTSVQYGTYFPLDRWIQFNFVIYKSSFAGWLWPIADFWSALSDAITDSSYEWQVRFIDDGTGNLDAELHDGKGGFRKISSPISEASDRMKEVLRQRGIIIQ